MEPELLPRPRRYPSRLIAVPVMVVAALALLAVAFLPIGGEPLPSMYVTGSQAPGVAIGQIAPGTARAPGTPPLALTDLDGAPVSLEAFAGHPVWIIFWRSACEPCEAEAPAVAAAYKAHRADGLIVLGIDMWDSVEDVRAYTDTHPLRFPLAIDPGGAFGAAYGVWGAPTHYFTDAAGTVVARYFGPISGAQIEESLRKIL